MSFVLKIRGKGPLEILTVEWGTWIFSGSDVYAVSHPMNNKDTGVNFFSLLTKIFLSLLL